MLQYLKLSSEGKMRFKNWNNEIRL